MYAKIFAQIFDSSIAGDWQVRHVFEDLLKLADANGVVDMTPDSISRRANIPIEIVARAINALEKPDPQSRNPREEGRRIIRLDDHRDWGWIIVNYEHYRGIVSEEQRREKTRLRVRKHRSKGDSETPSNACNADVTHGNACNATETETKKIDGDEKALRLAPPTASKESLWNQIVEDVRDTFGFEWPKEAKRMKQLHGQNPDKFWRVLAELKQAIKDNRVKTTKAKFFEDTWKWFK